jgi:hypothetical protein
VRTCTACKEEKPDEGYYFQKHANGRTYACQPCRECTKAKRKAARDADPDEYRERARRYRSNNREKNLARTREWVKANPDRKRELDRQWRDANRERKAANDKRWAEANRDRMRENHRRFRERHPDRVKLNAWIQASKRRGEKMNAEAKAYSRIISGDPCAYCGAPMEEIDHIVPRPQWEGEGWNDWSNLSAACRSCNRSKADRSLLTFLLS